MWNLDDKSLFRSGALGEMRSNKAIQNPELFLDEAVEAFAANEDMPVVDELMRFRAFIKDVKFTVNTFTPDNLSVSLTSPAGEGEVTIGLHANISRFDDKAQAVAPSQTEIDMTAITLLKQLVATYKAIQTAAPNLGLSSKSAGQANDQAASEVIIEEHMGETLEVGTWKGKTTYKIRAGWFTQFGAPVYPETLKACGYTDVLNVPVGTTIPFAHPITVHVRDGKPVIKKIG